MSTPRIPRPGDGFALRRLCARLLFPALLAGPLAAQTTTDPGDAAPAAGKPDPGRAALAAVARFQRGDAPRPRPERLHGRFHVGARNAEGAYFQLEVERWYEREPERLRTSRREQATGVASTTAWSAGRAWFRDDDGGRVVIYTDNPELHEVDLELIEQDLRLTRLLLDAVVLDALLPRLLSVRIAGTTHVTDLDGEQHAALVVEALLPDVLFGPDPRGAPPAPDDEEPRLRLRFLVDAVDGDAFDGTLWSLAVLAPHRPDVESFELRFDLYGRAPSGLMMPGNIRLLAGPAGEERMKLGAAMNPDGTLLFDVDGTFGPEVFAEPTRR